MPRPAHASPQTLAVLSALLAEPAAWRHGLSLSKETGLKSGTLYPLLIRLADQGFLEARWLEPERPGRPARHAYRLTLSGVALARERTARARPLPPRLRSILDGA
ncbi:MAG TPA: PadR family transcriptional regulator [Caulobacteraceae bacterium]|jgi:DNA-binding PadR family transcriptional regulator